MEEDIAMHNPAGDIPKSVKRRVMANDRRVMGTYHSVAASTVDDERGGRFAVEGKQTVIGSSAVAYPQQPSTSPWHSEPIGTEPPLGFDVNAIEPVGEPHEIRASATPSSSTAFDGDVRPKFRRRI
jgi:hypothetical protein